MLVRIIRNKDGVRVAQNKEELKVSRLCNLVIQQPTRSMRITEDSTFIS